jgi:hypothetical protein
MITSIYPRFKMLDNELERSHSIKSANYKAKDEIIALINCFGALFKKLSE